MPFRPRLRTLAFAFTTFWGAFLLFQMQPLLGRLLLPRFGGSAAVWLVCLGVFQGLLLLGYVYAHVLATRLAAARQALLHVGLLLLTLATLPIGLARNAGVAPGADPVLPLVFALLTGAGLPYLLLSSTAPLLQAWYAATASASTGAQPYRFYVLSNLGSMLGLLGYPVLVEPALTLQQQTRLWSAGYVAFVLLAAAAASLAARGVKPVATGAAGIADQAPSRRLSGMWVLLAACPSLLLSAITTHLTEAVAPMPLLWVLPLGLYLLSFMLCFDGTRWYRRSRFVPLALVASAFLVLTLIGALRGSDPRLLTVALCACLFAIAMTCHGELYALRPAPAHLTRFYLAVALGGMLGGLFVGVIAPHVFDAYYELPLGVVLTLLLLFSVLVRDRNGWLSRGRVRMRRAAFLSLPAIAAVALAANLLESRADARVMTRNFYGALRIADYGAGDSRIRLLSHGRITHGTQFLAPAYHALPTSYYGPGTGAAVAIAATRSPSPQRIGVIGLGAGTMAAYGRAGDVVRFYEINPSVIGIAYRQFDYLHASQAHIETVLGDARLSLEREPAQRFDVLVVDAFSSDAIPVHLLTLEAFASYFRHLAPDGILAVHISNRYLDLAPVVRAAADHFGKPAWLIDNAASTRGGVYAATWVLVGNSLRSTPAREMALGIAKAPAARGALRPWSDDFSSLYQLLLR